MDTKITAAWMPGFETMFRADPQLVAQEIVSIGEKATFEVACVETSYSLDSVTNIINLAGFGLGIGSGRSSGYGRYHVIDVESC